MEVSVRLKSGTPERNSYASTPQSQSKRAGRTSDAKIHLVCDGESITLSGMSVKATINGEVWEFSTVAEAAEFRRSLIVQEMALPVRGRGRPSKTSKQPVRDAASRRAGRLQANASGVLSEGSRQILEAIRRTPDGLQSEEFAHAIGSPRPRSVPPRMMMLGKDLKALGLKPGDVIQRDRIYVKGRARSVFKPGPRLEDALLSAGGK